MQTLVGTWKQSKSSRQGQEQEQRRSEKQTTSQNLWARINSLIKTARSAVSNNSAERGCCFFCASRTIFKNHISNRVGKSISAFLG